MIQGCGAIEEVTADGVYETAEHNGMKIDGSGTRVMAVMHRGEHIECYRILYSISGRHLHALETASDARCGKWLC